MKFLTMYVLLNLAIMINLTAEVKFEPPLAKKIPVTETIHGLNFTDYYRWLEDKENPEVKEWSHKQHDYTLDFINKSCKEIPGIKDEIRAYIDRDYTGAPFFKGNREFFHAKKRGEQQYKIYTRFKGKEILIFDPMKFDSSGKSSVTGFVLTEDGNKAAIGMQFKGDEISDYRIIDTKNGKVLGEIIKNLSGFSWTKDEKHAYLTRRSKEDINNQIPLKTFLHKIGDKHENDKFLGSSADAKDSWSIWDSEEGGVTFISTGDFYSNTLYIRKQGTFDEPKMIYSSKKYIAYPHVKNNRIYFYTNHEAPNYKLMFTEIDKPEFNNWKEFYSEKETMLESYSITKSYVIIQDKKDLLSRLTAYDTTGRKITEIPAPELADIGGMSYHKESNTVFVSLNTFTAPSKLYKLDGTTLKWEFFWQDKPPIDTKDIEGKISYYYSKDSTRIPVFILHRKGLKQDGNNPAILYGYGGFNAGFSPSYAGLNAMFINRGGVYAIACLRGGNEYGENWHKAGMLDKKQNVYDDFIAAAEFLIKEKYTIHEKLAVKGGSNGGLLIGAILTQRPDLFKAAICAVPLLDMLRYHKFLIARYWIPEYGDPEKIEDFRFMLSYSPYHNIKQGVNIPTTMVKAGENDSRVDPLHAKKFAAALQNNPWQKNPVLLYIDFNSGHGSGQSVDQQVNNIEIEWRWLMNQIGIK